MRRISLQVASNVQELSKLAAEHFVRLATESQNKKQLFKVVLSGGSTPKALYELLADEDQPYREQFSWEDIHFFWGDERHVPPDHPDNNYRMANDAMLSRVPIPLTNVHRIKSEIADAGEAADEYEQTLRKFFSLDKGHFPRFDLILLGMGSDGHTTSIFPNSDVISERTRLVVATWVEKLKSFRITVTPPLLNNAASIIFLVSGAEKAKTLHEVLEGEYRPRYLPVQLVAPATGEVLWLADREAARFLRGRPLG